MTRFANASRTIVIKASRETIGLVVAASAMAFVMAYVVHSRPTPTTISPVQRDWTGELSGGVDPNTAGTTEPFKSADLVVPNAQLALPALPARPTIKRACDDASCAKPVPAPVRRTVARSEPIPRARPEKDPSLLTTLNPLNHVPSLSTMGKPFTFAGDVVSGWIKRF